MQSKMGWESGVKTTKGQRGGGRLRPGTGDNPNNSSKRMGDGKKKDWGVDKPKRERRCPWGRFAIEFTRASEDISEFCFCRSRR